MSKKYIFCENLIFLGIFVKKIPEKKERVVIGFHLRPFLLKSDENFSKYFTFGTISGSAAQKKLFSHKMKNF